MVRGKTKSGIEFIIDERKANDARVLRLLLKAQDKNATEEEAGRAIFNLLDFVFGGGENVDVFMDEVALRHDGVCDTGSLTAELNEIFTKAKLKNSSSSPEPLPKARKN